MSIKTIDKNNYALSTNIDNQLTQPKRITISLSQQHINHFQFFKKTLPNREGIASDLAGKQREVKQLQKVNSQLMFAKIKSNYYQPRSGKAQIQQTAQSFTCKIPLSKINQNSSSESSKKKDSKNAIAFVNKINIFLKNQLKDIFKAMRDVQLVNILQSKKNNQFIIEKVETINPHSKKKLYKIYHRGQLQILRKEKLIEAAHKIKGWIQFKLLIIMSITFKEVCQYLKQRMTQSLLFSESPKSDAPLSNFSLSDYGNESRSLSLQKKYGSNFNESLVYTLDYNLQVSPKQQVQTSPEKSINEEKHSYTNLRIREGVDDTQSVVQLLKPISKMSSLQSKMKGQTSYPALTIRKPIHDLNFKQRRYLLVRTNIYELPVLSDIEFNFENKSMAKMNAKADILVSNAPESNLGSLDMLMKDLQATNYLFQPCDKSSNDKFDNSPKYRCLKRKSAIIRIQESQVNEYNADLGLHFNRIKGKDISFNQQIQQPMINSPKINTILSSPRNIDQHIKFKLDRSPIDTKPYYAIPQPSLLSPTDGRKKELQSQQILSQQCRLPFQNNNSHQIKYHILSLEQKDLKTANKQHNISRENLSMHNRFEMAQRQPVTRTPQNNRCSLFRNIQVYQQNPSIRIQQLSIKPLYYSPEPSKQIYSYRSPQIQKSHSPSLKPKQYLDQQQLGKHQLNQFSFNNINFNNNYYATATANTIKSPTFPKTDFHWFRQQYGQRGIKILEKPLIISGQSTKRINNRVDYSSSFNGKEKSPSMNGEDKNQMRQRSSKSKLTVTLKQNK